MAFITSHCVLGEADLQLALVCSHTRSLSQGVAHGWHLPCAFQRIGSHECTAVCRFTAGTCCVPFSAVDAMCCVAQVLVGLPLGTDSCTSDGPMHTQARRCLPARAGRILLKRCRAVVDGPRMQRRPLSIKLGSKAARPPGWRRPLARMQV